MTCAGCGYNVQGDSEGGYHCTHCGHNGQCPRIPVVVVGPGKKLGMPVCEALCGSPDDFELFAVVGRHGAPQQSFGNVGYTGGRAVGSVGSFAELARTYGLPKETRECERIVVFYAVKSPVAMLSRVREAVHAGFCIHVIGTTGLSPDEMSELGEMASISSALLILYASNFSVGANVGAEQCAVLARRFPDAGAEIVEQHHDQKEDAPSGTALLWARAIAAARGHVFDDVVKYGRHGKGKRTKEEVCIHSLRGGGVTGFHRATFFGPDDEISVEHNARSSRLFALGALDAIRWAHEYREAILRSTSLEFRLFHMYDVLDLPLLKELNVY